MNLPKAIIILLSLVACTTPSYVAHTTEPSSSYDSFTNRTTISSPTGTTKDIAVQHSFQLLSEFDHKTNYREDYIALTINDTHKWLDYKVAYLEGGTPLQLTEFIKEIIPAVSVVFYLDIYRIKITEIDLPSRSEGFQVKIHIADGPGGSILHITPEMVQSQLQEIETALPK